jgi:hypothetical protein
VSEGDTVSIPGFYADWWATDTTFTFYVDSVRIALYDTAMLKTIYTHPIIDSSTFTVYSTYQGPYVEKIGCVYNGIYPACVGVM